MSKPKIGFVDRFLPSVKENEAFVFVQAFENPERVAELGFGAADAEVTNTAAALGP
jgi:hypothetical protein